MPIQHSNVTAVVSLASSWKCAVAAFVGASRVTITSGAIASSVNVCLAGAPGPNVSLDVISKT